MKIHWMIWINVSMIEWIKNGSKSSRPYNSGPFAKLLFAMQAISLSYLNIYLSKTLYES